MALRADKVLVTIDELTEFGNSLLADLVIMSETARTLFPLVSDPKWSIHTPAHISLTLSQLVGVRTSIEFSVDQLATLRGVLEGDYLVKGLVEAEVSLHETIDDLGRFRRLAVGTAERLTGEIEDDG